jgi:CheY-like chemotaxis protein
LQNGDIEVTSEQGKGTTFHFHIPYQISEEQLNIQSKTDTQYFKDNSNAPLKVLIVDDNAINQNLMKHLLSQWNIDFDTANNGLEAVEFLKNNDCDLVLMDIQMPQMDGYVATQTIREELKLNLPIIAMTAHALAGERERCMSRGMNEYISKPIKEDELFKLISNFGLKEAEKTETQTVETAFNYEFIELSYMKSISNEDKDFERTVTQQFLDKVPTHLQELKLAYDNKDFKLVKLRAHDLKSSVAIMGLLPLLEEKLNILELTNEENPESKLALEEVKDILLKSFFEAKLFLKSI